MARRQKLSSVANVSCTLVFYEAPHRIQAALEDVQDVLGDREVCVAREITKIHEEFLVGKLTEVRPQVKELGEFVVVVSGGTEMPATASPLTREEVLKKLGMTRNELYDLFFKKRRATE
jgi:16S rRNA (cytidine1402-2'-O)-methyltransferase